jgi:hypothetical protein
VDRQAAQQIWSEVKGTRGCAHPIRLAGEQLNLATGEIRSVSVRVACGDRRALICPRCSYLYKADAFILVTAGLEGGKGIDSEVAAHPRLFVSLTAPSFGAVHTQGRSGSCRPHGGSRRCDHGFPRSCSAHHGGDDPVLGTPLCAECFDYDGAVLWNATASHLWNRTVVSLREKVASSQRLSIKQLHEMARLNYLKVAEFQRRGLVHFHVVIRADGPDGPNSHPPAWLTSEFLARRLKGLIEEVDATTVLGDSVGWGSQFDVADFSGVGDESRKVASYVAKYATKTTDGSMGFARRFTTRSRIEFARSDAHAKRIALAAWDLGEVPQLESLHLRDHAHSFGFTGQLITKSRGFSTTFSDLRAARAAFRVNVLEEDPVEGRYGYTGRGYEDPRAERVAGILHEMNVEMHKEAKQRRLETQERK